MAKAFLILPNQLTGKLPAKNFDHFVIVEHSRYFSDFQFHKKKLLFHRASLKYYRHLLESKNYRVSYLDHQTVIKRSSLTDWLNKNRVKSVSLYDPVDNVLKKHLIKEFDAAQIALEFLESPLFLCRDEFLKDYFADKKHYSMNSFYISQRKCLNILLDDGKPSGGKWSFDTQNRRPLTDAVKVPGLAFPRINQYVKEAAAYVEKNFPENPGTAENFFYPVNHKQAANWLQDFLEHRLDLFGTYEDAISAKERFLFHSVLSPLLNSALIAPDQVLHLVAAYSQTHRIRLNSLEGFIRQIIGWREFIRAVYVSQGHKQFESNFWGFDRHLPRQFYNAATAIEPVDCIIRAIMKNAYAHHIERLMILGNFMLLCEIHPTEVYRWFMELFIDAYDWVMVPNLFGMSQYADGGLITTKPYISSSNYLRKMSDFKAGPWCDIWDSLFWRFIHKHKKVFAQNPRMKIMALQIDRMEKTKVKGYIKQAEKYLESLF